MPNDRLAHLTAIRDARLQICSIRKRAYVRASALLEKQAIAQEDFETVIIGEEEAAIALAEAEIALLDAQP
jgi:hypothetical protein